MNSRRKKSGALSFVRRLACENSKFHIYFDDIETSDGSVVRDYLVVAPKVSTENLITGIAVLPVVYDRIGLLKIFRHPMNDYSWEVPRGFIESGEDDATSALRELEEETGLKCRPDDLIPLGCVTPEPGVLAARMRCYVASRCVAFKPYAPEELGHREFCLIEPDEVGRMIWAGSIQDPCTLLSCFRYFDLVSGGKLLGN